MENILESKPYNQETAFNTMAILGQVTMGTQENVKMKGINLDVNAILFDLLLEKPEYKKPLKHYFRNYKEAIKSCFLEEVHDRKFNIVGFKANEKRVKFLELFADKINKYIRREIEYSQTAVQPVYVKQAKKEPEKKETETDELLPFVKKELDDPGNELDKETKEPVPRPIDKVFEHMQKTGKVVMPS